jgi:Prolipoprotein diacylglyceryltransferase
MGRWGNFLNQEAFGNLVTNPKLQWFPYAVFIENQNGWYQATFFYESFWNVIGFVFIMLWLLKWKNNRRGIATSFYFLWYGIGRLWIEGLRSDSLYLKIFGYQTE